MRVRGHGCNIFSNVPRRTKSLPTPALRQCKLNNIKVRLLIVLDLGKSLQVSIGRSWYDMHGTRTVRTPVRLNIFCIFDLKNCHIAK